MPTTYELVVQSGPSSYFTGAPTPAKGDVHRLSTEKPNVVGRSPDSSICIKDGFVARTHCEIKWDIERNQFAITDLDSYNGTFVNGAMLNKSQTTVLWPGDEIQCGRTSFLFQTTRNSNAQCYGDET